MSGPEVIADSPAARRLVLARLREGGVVSLPTETFYGLCADPRSAAAVERLLRLKGGREGRPLPLLAGERAAAELAVPGWRGNPLAELLAARFWPGPLTLVLPAEAALARSLGSVDGSVGIRWGAPSIASSVARTFGWPIIATSANPTGGPPSRSAAEVAGSFADGALLLLDGGSAPGGEPSTVVDVRAEPVRILRPGPIAAADLDLACSRGGR